MTEKNTFSHTTGSLIACGDADIYVEEIGRSELSALVMLHGGFGNIEDLNTITPALCRQFRLIGIDSRGHGKSNLGNTDLSYELLADDLAQVIETLQLKEFNIFGFSDGGIAAYRYAVRKNPELKKIISVGARWEMSKEDPAWEMLFGMTGDLWKQMFPHSYESYMRLNPKPDFDRFAEAVVSMWTDLSSSGHPRDLMAQITNEMLVVRGDNDPLTTLDSIAKLRGISKNTNIFNIPFAEHVAFDDATDVFLMAVDRFFDSKRAVVSA